MSSLVGRTTHQGSGVVGQSPKDSVVAIYYAQPVTKGSVVNETWTYSFVSGNRKSGTSKFLCMVVITYGQYTNNANTDAVNPKFKWRHIFNNSSGVATTTDITDPGGYDQNHWFSSDVPTINRTNVIYNGAYDTTQNLNLAQIIEPPKGNVGDPFQIQQRVAAHTDGIWLGRCRATAGHGCLGGMVCYEIETSSSI